jgi:hypothetical protein
MNGIFCIFAGKTLINEESTLYDIPAAGHDGGLGSGAKARGEGCVADDHRRH